MNSIQSKDKLKNVSKEKNVNFNTLLRLFMYDRFIERLSVSKYKDNFILKGGFYLSTLFGVESRSTMDIDASFRNYPFTEENIINMIKEIIEINLNDNTTFDYNGTSPIRDEDEYGGYRIELVAHFENIREMFHIDIATGDPITPSAISYKYQPLLLEKVINVLAYSIETVIAEKLSAIFTRLELSSRLRDYYDIYLIYNKEWDNLNKNNLKLAIKNTFNYRKNEIDFKSSFEIIKNSKNLHKKWKAYSKKFEYAKDISFNEILKCINNIISDLKI